ncbi:16667_t:CDS:2 [Cetraspora pellucida]|uniref:16667_t:CDS:1 n=1 Tax=Cetraspora pellucida TaxID=1433469 RepID=A0A9N9HZ06_9GLOM|nr:16667_t:CDS:2 [Cetraspora pellucida]
MHNKNNDLSDLEHDDRLIYNSVVTVQKNEKSGFSEEKLSLNRKRFFNGIEFTQEMCECVAFYVNVIKLKPLQIKKALKQEFPDYEIYLFKVHKATAKFYCEKQKDISNDAASLYENLLRKKKEDPYCDIILNDNTAKTNRYDKALSLFLYIDNHGLFCLIELSEALETSINEESNKTKYIYWKTQIPLMSSVIMLPQALFPEVDKTLTSSITKAELIKYQKPELDTTQFIEDDKDVMQVSVNYMLRNVDVNRIEETWAICTITALKFCYFVILLSDKTYVCSCLGLLMRDNTNKLFTPIADLQNERKEDISEQKLY